MRWTQEARANRCTELYPEEVKSVTERVFKSARDFKAEHGESAMHLALMHEIITLSVFQRVQREHIDLLESQLEVIEEKGFSYKGVWKHGSIYNAGDWITFGGSMWHVKRTHAADLQPGH